MLLLHLALVVWYLTVTFLLSYFHWSNNAWCPNNLSCSSIFSMYMVPWVITSWILRDKGQCKPARRWSFELSFPLYLYYWRSKGNSKYERIILPSFSLWSFTALNCLFPLPPLAPKNSQLRSHRCNRRLIFELVDWGNPEDSLISGSQLIETIWSKISSFPSADCKEVLEDIDAIPKSKYGLSLRCVKMRHLVSLIQKCWIVHGWKQKGWMVRGKRRWNYSILPELSHDI